MTKSMPAAPAAAISTSRKWRSWPTALAHDPAVRQRYEAVQRLDASPGRSVPRVPVPAGLADRLLAGCSNRPQPPKRLAVKHRPQKRQPRSPCRQSGVAASPSRRLRRGGGSSRWRRRFCVAMGLWALPLAGRSRRGEMTSEAAQWFSSWPTTWQPIDRGPGRFAAAGRDRRQGARVAGGDQGGRRARRRLSLGQGAGAGPSCSSCRPNGPVCRSRPRSIRNRRPAA